MEEKLKKQIGKAVSVLKNGRIVAFPTDTVYGIGADFQNEPAVKKIFIVKGRESDNPLTLLLADAKELDPFVKTIPKTAQRLIQTFWPGPLTLIFKASGKVPAYLLGPDSTIGIRVSGNETARALIQSFGSPLATTSANMSGEEPLRSGNEVSSKMGERIDYVLPGFCGFAPPSTVLNLSRFPPGLERKGAISPLLLGRTMRRKVRLGKNVFFKILLVCTGNACRSPMAEGLLKKMLPPDLSKKLMIASAGTAALEGGRPTEFAIAAANELGAEIKGLMCRELSPEIITGADLILCMEQNHRDRVAEMVPEAWKNTDLLKGYGKEGLPKYEREIEDPIGLQLAAYRRAAREIQSNLMGVVSELIRRLLP